MNPPTLKDLLDQPYLFDSELTIQKLIEKQSQTVKADLHISSILRLECGENVQKKQGSFADEVQQILSKK